MGRHPLLRVCVLVSLAFGSSVAQDGRVGAPRSGVADERMGVPWTGGPGVTETVAEIMEREARTPAVPSLPHETKPFFGRPVLPMENPSAAAVSQWPPSEGGAALPGTALDAASFVVSPLAVQTVGTNFKAISLLSPNESQFIPPDSMGDVGPTQILAMANGRIKVFDRTGVLGSLDVTDSTFFSSIAGGAGVTDPQVRYDRLSGRWFVTELTTSAPNRILIAVSSGSTITATSSFTFFFFQNDLVGPTPNSDTGGFADYDSLGVGNSALYVGVNVFSGTSRSFLGSTGFVVNKGDLLAGTLTVTAFRQLSTVRTSGPFAPRGVTNDDPGATEGYFIGVDILVLGQLDLRRVSNPGGTPSISGNLVLTVPKTTMPILQVVEGSSSKRRLDSLDERLFAAAIHKNKITGSSTLWTAHNIEVDNSGVGTVGGGRNGSRWYEITNLTGIPTLNQAGTLFDPAAINPRGFWIDTVSVSGQGHMALGSSYASVNDFAGVATAGRFRTDALGTIQTPTLAQVSSTAYNVQNVDGQRWGDYSQTIVDPADDMTLWTIQEWCDTTNSWGVQVVQLKAPPPATPASASPSSVCSGLASVNVTVTGTSSSGSEFFDPGADAGGPGYPDRLSASVTGGVSVNSLTFTDPTHIILNLSTVAATTGTKDVTITNPDGQSSTGIGILAINGVPAPAAANNSPICAGATLQLSAATIAGAAYSWTGPNGFTSSAQNPSIPNATPAASGTYGVTVTVNGCASSTSTTAATVIANGATCSDGNACTVGDACQAGICQSGPLRDADGDGHVDVLCGGDDCNDNDPLVWFAPREVTGLLVSTASPADLAWDNQGTLVGPETTYDLVSGLISGAGVDFSGAACLQSRGGSTFGDARPDPGVGTAYWYLARGRNSCGVGTYGTSQQDSSVSACP
jgi:hypothetical protein